ncbi:ubiquinol oxidase subunit II [Rhodopila globiformis]|uniref:Ubiquinol oxidase subunit 2 n=1 Tax=Rhodopila globiformis TaxID=1071 RepID=A0A2S6NP60_RHOGL|nr:ubiquinol oxidase subunit II [Rhodopila globiformis]
MRAGGIRPRRARRRAFLGRAAVVLPLALAGCGPSVLDPQGPIGAADKSILIDSLAIMLAIVIPTIVAILGFAWWFRASNPRAKYRPDFVYSGRVEMIVWSIPLLTIILLGGVIWIGSYELDPAKPIGSPAPALEVQGVSLDWKWLFIYPDQGIAAVNQLVIPAGIPVHFSLTSASVMTAFFVPRLGSMIYTMNGMTTNLNLQADKPGTFWGEAAHFSGDGFPTMHFDVKAVPAAQFTDWVDATRNARSPALDPPAYLQLEKQSMSVAPFTYREIDPLIYQMIVTQKLPPGPGPATTPHSQLVRPERTH